MGAQYRQPAFYPVGLDVRAFMQASLPKGCAIALLDLGEQTVIDMRETIVRTIFSSLIAEAGEHDALLVGIWKFLSYKDSTDGRYRSETSRLISLQFGRDSGMSRGQ